MLEPESDIDVVDGQFAARSNNAWLKVSPGLDLAKYRWVRLRYISSYFDDPVRPLIRFSLPDGNKAVQPMNGPVLGRGEWVGRVPVGTTAISISPVNAAGAFDFELVSMQSVARQWLVGRGLVQDRSSLASAIGAKVINAEQERWDMLKFAGTSTGLHKYDDWHALHWRQIDVAGIDRPRFDWSRGPTVRLFVALERGNVLGLNSTLRSLRDQAYTKWSLHALTSPTTPADVLAAYRNAMMADARLHAVSRDMDFPSVVADFAADDITAVMGFGDGLPDHALAVVAERLARQPELRIVYGDEDALSTWGVLHSPILKPDWSPLLFGHAPFLGRLTCVRFDDVARLGLATAGELIDNEEATIRTLVTTMKADEIGHVRRILYRRWRDLGVIPIPSPAEVAARLAPAVSQPAPEPEVSIVIPTRDHADLLSQCVKSIQAVTAYPKFNIVIVDNGSVEKDALALLRDLESKPDIQIVRAPGPFNFSALSNQGAGATDSPVIVFLNSDTVVFEAGWLSALVKYAVRPDVGVVGAKLLYPSNKIQHAGVVLGHGGIAGHLYINQPGTAKGYMRQLTVPHEVSAVTGACIAIEREKFDAVGGFDAENMPVDLNDIDLCLRNAARGWLTVWTPESVLYHLHSASRGFKLKPTKVYRKEREFFMKQWPHVVRDDPFFHPALSLYSYTPALA